MGALSLSPTAPSSASSAPSSMASTTLRAADVHEQRRAERSLPDCVQGSDHVAVAARFTFKP
eukprot:m.950481 g.950481  ORF g.950481 m.950481 type:complete len:62 (-) comp330570_c0_seq1:147-332(-)